MPAPLAYERDRLDYLLQQAEARVCSDLLLFEHLRGYYEAGTQVPWPILERMFITQAEAN